MEYVEQHQSSQGTRLRLEERFKITGAVHNSENEQLLPVETIEEQMFWEVSNRGSSHALELRRTKCTWSSSLRIF